MMNRPLITGCILMIAIQVLSPQSVKAQNSQECIDAIESGKSRLENVPNLRLSNSGDRNSSGFRNRSSSSDSLPRRFQTYSFVMEKSSGINDVFNSPKFMTDISKPIIQKCSSVASVSFVLLGSGAVKIIGLFPNGEIKPFKCAEDFGIYPGDRTRTNGLTWGMYFCSI
jgi:hypothetical protein